jgi:CheY-like chemotaxis protein
MVHIENNILASIRRIKLYILKYEINLFYYLADRKTEKELCKVVYRFKDRNVIAMTSRDNITNTTDGEHDNILVLDDELDITTVITISLRKNDFNLFGFTNPFLALEHLQMNFKDYGIILSDIRMPGMNGFEFVKKSKEFKLDVKVLLMTAFDTSTNIISDELLSTKINGFIQKPVSRKELTSIL